MEKHALGKCRLSFSIYVYSHALEISERNNLREDPCLEMQIGISKYKVF